MSWIGTSASPPRTARSSTALIAYSPFAEIRMTIVAGSVRPAPTGAGLRQAPVASSAAASLQEARRLAREIGDHHVRPRPPNSHEGLHHGALLVEPAQSARRADHRVLAGDRVGGQRHAELRLR